MNKKYWKGIDELVETPEFLEAKEQEFPSQTSIEEFLGDEKLNETSTGRRDFLKFLGFSVAAATVAACEAPVTKAVPYVNKPEDVTPGMPKWYASTYYDGNSYASIMVKTREGRPIYIKGNKEFGITGGGTNAQVIASVLDLYNSARLTGPQMKKGGNWESAKYAKVDPMIANALKTSKSVALVSGSVISPAMLMAIDDLKLKLGGTRNEETQAIEGSRLEHVQYDAVSYAGMRVANKATFGITDPAGDREGNGSLPSYDFSEAKTIVSVGADFLGTWMMSTQYAGQYASRRNPDGDWMSKHFQFESNMSITGSNADVRGMIKPSEQANVLAAILKGLGKSTGGASASLDKDVQAKVNKAVKALKSSGKHSLVVCGSNNKSLQILTNKINHALGAYDKTINLNAPVYMFQSEDDKMRKLVNAVNSGKGPEAVIFMGVNPVYSLPNGEKFGKKLSSVKHKISLSMYCDETADLCDVIVPEHHALEDWRDHNAVAGHYAIGQPTIRPLHKTASALESIRVWTGEADRGGKDSQVAYNYIRKRWVKYGYEMDEAATAKYSSAEEYFNLAVHRSGEGQDGPAASTPEWKSGAMSGLKFPKGGGTEVVLYQKAGIGTGAGSNNPWLQEMADPISKVTWDNYITMNPADMKGKYETYFDQESGLDQATITVNGSSVTLPVYPTPGQALGTVGVALGYGRGASPERIGGAAYRTMEYGGHETDENGNAIAVGQNAYPMASWEGGMLSMSAANVNIKPAEGKYLIASTQIHNTVAARHSIVRETTLDIYNSKESEAYNAPHLLGKLDKDGHHVSVPISEFDLWDEHPVENIGHRWGMTIDLSSCFGCGSCLIACQSENNVPVVGKDEVRRGREMAWLRIDRYYASEVEVAVGQRDEDKFSYAEAEKAQLNPSVVHMPMMCHHCNHAPCETVCPVAATTHSNEGLNQMTYNRCIGTRYCANNCPYKVRRFNWFNYPSYKKMTEINPAQDDLGRMVLNPDVTVRTRGVMEKCSMCVQRIQAGKLEAKKAGRPVMDGDYSTACADACPAHAITVGDWNDKESGLRKSADNKRSYQALEEVGVKPNVWFKVKVRNDENKELAAIQKGGHGHGDGHGENKHGHNSGHGHEENGHH